MLNSYSYQSKNNTQIHINAINGTIVKNYPKSFFKRFHLTSPYADKVLREGGHKTNNGFTTSETPNDVVVIQMMMCGDMEVIAELMYRKDFDELFQEKELIS